MNQPVAEPDATAGATTLAVRSSADRHGVDRRPEDGVPPAAASSASPRPISVVVPVHNGLATLRAALESVQDQASLPAEVVVVDDGSTDGDVGAAVKTWAAAAAWPVPVHVARQSCGGPSRARNRGLLLAGQPWIAFLDADDTWETDKLTRQWDVAAAQPDDLVLVSSNWLRPGEPARPSDRDRRVSVWRDATRRILWINRFQTSSVLVRRRAMLDVGGFDARRDGAEDWDAWARVATRGWVAHVHRPLVRYADTPSGVSKDLRRVYRAGLDMLEQSPLAVGRGPARARLIAWHHVRFAWALWRLGQPAAARAAWLAAWRRGTRLRAVEVVLSGLLPFLAGRTWRRLRGRRL